MSCYTIFPVSQPAGHPFRTAIHPKVTHYNKKSNERDIFLCENYNFVILNQKGIVCAICGK